MSLRKTGSEQSQRVETEKEEQPKGIYTTGEKHEGTMSVEEYEAIVRGEG